MDEKITQLFIKYKEENDIFSLIELSKEFKIPKEIKTYLFEVCYIFFYF